MNAAAVQPRTSYATVQRKPEAVQLLSEAVPLTNNRSNDEAVRNMRYIAWRVILAETRMPAVAYQHYRDVVEKFYGVRG